MEQWVVEGRRGGWARAFLIDFPPLRWDNLCMDQKRTSKSNRRDFLKTTSTIAAASALSGIIVPHVHAAGDETIRLALVGCGGRGGGAALNALSTTSGPIKLIAMADVFDDHLKVHYDSIKKRFGDDVDVPPE